MTHSPVVSIIGGTIWGNRGAEAMLVTTIGEVRRRFPGAQFKIFSYYPSHDRELIQADPAVEVCDSRPLRLALIHFPFAFVCGLFRLLGVRLPDALLPGDVRALRASDVLLDVGGITFADGRAIFLLFNVLTIWPAMLLGTPVIKLAQATGPFETTINHRVAGIFLRRCHQIYARGDMTAAHLQTLDLPSSQWQRSADIAFLYDPDYSLSAENEDRLSALDSRLTTLREDGTRIAAFTPSSLVYQNAEKIGSDYAGRFLNIIRELDQPDLHFIFIPNATRATSDKPRNNDLYAINAIQRRAEAELSPEVLNRIDWVDFDVNTKAIRRLLSRADVLLTSRFHAMIAGLSLTVPTVVLGWSHKYEETLADFGMAHYAIPFDDTDTSIVSLIHNLLNTHDDVQRTIAQALEEVRTRSAKQFADLQSFLAES